jgi:hypothetical protein
MDPESIRFLKQEFVGKLYVEQSDKPKDLDVQYKQNFF